MAPLVKINVPPKLPSPFVLIDPQSIYGQPSRPVSYDYTNRSQISTISLDSISPADSEVTYAYDANGCRVSKTLENGVVASYTYDVANRLTNTSGSTVVASSAYTLNSVGNRTSKSDEGGTAAKTIITPPLNVPRNPALHFGL